MKNFKKTMILTGVFSLTSIIVAFSVQTIARSKAGLVCSYLDPITIDILAFIVGIFLVLDGFHRIYEHKNDRVVKQFTRIIRISIGFALLTIHTIQFIYK